MKNSKQMAAFIKKLYEEETDRYLQQHRPEAGRDTLTEEEKQAICNAMLAGGFLNDRQPQPAKEDYEHLASLYQRVIPKIKVYEASKERKARQQQAAEKYLAGQMKIYGYAPGYEYFARPDGEAAPEKDRELFAAMKNQLEGYTRFLKEHEGKLSDDDLVNTYEQYAGAIRLVLDAPVLLQRLREQDNNGIDPQALAEFENLAFELRPQAAMLEKRMAVMADPYYPYVDLELLLEAEPEKQAEIRRALQKEQRNEEAEFLLAGAPRGTTSYRNNGAIRPSAKENALAQLQRERDNASYWENISAIYGPSRKLRSDWMAEFSDHSVYTLDDWRMMQKQQVDIEKLNSEDLKLDERTFTALNMILSLRKRGDKDLHGEPDTRPFEDIVEATAPLFNTRVILEPIVEPTRERLIWNLENFGITRIDKGGDAGQSILARDLADALFIYIKHLHNFGFNKRYHSVLAEAGATVLAFADAYYLTDIMKLYRLSDEQLEKVRIAGAMGKIINEGFNAEADLVLEQEGRMNLSPQQRRACIDKIMLRKAIEADISANQKEPNAGGFMAMRRKKGQTEEEHLRAVEKARYEYLLLENDVEVTFSATAKNIPVDGSLLKAMSLGMMSEEDREALAQSGSADILERLSQRSLVRDEIDRLKGKPVAGEVQPQDPPAVQPVAPQNEAPQAEKQPEASQPEAPVEEAQAEQPAIGPQAGEQQAPQPVIIHQDEERRDEGLLSPSYTTLKVVSQYGKEKKDHLAKKKKTDPAAILTEEDYQDINNKLLNDLTNEFQRIQPKPEAVPELVELYQREIPGFQRVPNREKAARLDKRQRAAQAYAQAMVKLDGYHPGYEDTVHNRDDQRFCRALSTEELEKYNRYFLESKDEYYEGKGMSPEEVKEAKQEANKQLDLLRLQAIKNTLKNYGEALAKPYEDDDLIKAYPDIANAIKVILESHVQLVKMKTTTSEEDVPRELLKAYDQRISVLMNSVPMLDKRIALMADPYYPELRMEALFEAGPVSVHKLNDAIDVATSDYISKRINVVSIVGDIDFANETLLDQQLAAAMGISLEEMKENMVMCDSSGNVRSMIVRTIPEMLQETGGRFYLVSKTEDKEPVPVMWDDAAGKLLIGKESIKPVGDALENTPPPRIGGLASFFNGIYEAIIKKPTETMKKHREAVDAFETSKAAVKAMATGDVPRVVMDAKLTLQNARHLAGVEEAMAAIASISPEYRMEETMGVAVGIPLEQASYFDRLLATIMVNHALTSNGDETYRNAMRNLLGVYEPGFGEAAALERLTDSNLFREFAWELRNQYPALLPVFLNDDAAIAGNGLTQVCELFVRAINACEGNPWDKQASEDYKQAMEEKVSGEKQDEAVRTEANHEAARDNGTLWRNILSFYGPSRELRPDWMSLSGGYHVYNMKDWQRMKETAFDIRGLQPEGKSMDERTFAALGMLLSLRRNEFFTARNLNADSHAHSAMPFEDIVSDEKGPRANSNMILAPIVEPTREKLRSYLETMNDTVTGEPFGPTGKELLARDMAEALKLYETHINDFDWHGRNHSVMAEVCEKVIDFVDAHDMAPLLMQNGLTDEDMERIQVSIALGRLVNDARNAEDDLRRDAEGLKKLSPEQRLNCIDRILLLKVARADVKACKQEIDAAALGTEMARQLDDLQKLRNENKIDHEEHVFLRNNITRRMAGETYGTQDDIPAEYSEILKDYAKGGNYLKELSYRMMPGDAREKLLEKKSGELLEMISNKDSEETQVKKWTAEFKAEEENIRKYQEHLTELKDKPGYQNVAPRLLEILETSTAKVRRPLINISDEGLMACDRILQKHPDINLGQALVQAREIKERAAREKSSFEAAKAAIYEGDREYVRQLTNPLYHQGAKQAGQPLQL